MSNGILKNKFIFHGIGQGLFYEGRIGENNDLRFVYDCGVFYGGSNADKKRTSIDKKDAEKFIDEHFKENSIDFIVISHLHADHVNLLPKLIKKLKPKSDDNDLTGRIFLPYFPNPQIYQYAFKAELISNGISSVDSNDLYTLLHNLYGIQDYNLENMAPDNNDRIINIDKKKISINIIDAKKKISSNIQNWNFMFFNRAVDDQTFQQLNVAIQKLLNSSNNSQMDFEAWLKTDTGKKIKNIKSIYKEVLKKDSAYHKEQHKQTLENLTSLILLHYPSCGAKTLLTGDVAFDDNLNNFIKQELRCHNYYLERWIGENIGKCNPCPFPLECCFQVLQAPHHGSWDNWESMEDWKYSAKKIVFSFGINNRHGHPSPLFFDEINNGNIHRSQIQCAYKDLKNEHSYSYCVEECRPICKSAGNCVFCP